MAKQAKEAKQAKDKKKKEKLTFTQAFQREVRGYAEAFVVAFVVITFAFTTVGVVGASMAPNLDGGDGTVSLNTIVTGDRVFIPKYATWLRRMNLMPDYQRGDVLVVREPKNAPTALARAEAGCNPIREALYQCRVFFIKRLIATAGDRLRIEKGQVYVNGVAIDQGFITDTGEITPASIDFPVIEVSNGQVSKFQGLIPGTYARGIRGDAPASIADNRATQLFYGSTLEALAPLPADAPENEAFIHEIIIPEGEYFVMGDNRSRGGSEDSRYFGSIPKVMIAGKAQTVIWPPRRNGKMNWRNLTPPEAFAAIPEPTIPAETE